MNYLIRFLLLLLPVTICAQKPDLQNLSILASRYLQGKEYAKAAEVYRQLYNETKSQTYFNNYLDCLIEIPDYEQAEKEIRKGLRGNTSDAYWYLQLGFLKKRMGQFDESTKMYQKAVDAAGDNPAEFAMLANQFILRREFEFAEKVYLKARAGQGNDLYSYELGRIYLYMRNYEKMLSEFMTWASLKENNLEVVKSNLQSVLATDNDGEVSTQLKTLLLKRIQAEPGQTMANRLLIWLYIQDQNFGAALRQSIALDKRTGQEDDAIFGLANISAMNKNYEEAEKAYNYLISKGANSDYYPLASAQMMQMYYDQFIDGNSIKPVQASLLEEKFRQFFGRFGRMPETAVLTTEHAHLLAFYLNRADEAITILNEAIANPRLVPEQLGELKTELADVNVYAGNLWDAVLIYSQVIESNKNNSLGDEVKFKKAKLGYYMGNFLWAKAQLDALRASTSKLIANDAMELALFISENIDEDSTAAPLQIFARADLQEFRNNDEGALAALDSIVKHYPYNSLEDDVDFRRATIFQKQGKYAEAAETLDSIVNNHGADMLADDALFRLAGIYEANLNQKEKAMELYKKMLTDYPGSVYVVDSRTAYRKLQDVLKSKGQTESERNKEDLFFQGSSPKP